MPRLPMSLRRTLILLVGVLAAAGSAAQTGPQPTLPTTRLTAGMEEQAERLLEVVYGDRKS